jgi:hypothetical protein
MKFNLTTVQIIFDEIYQNPRVISDTVPELVLWTSTRLGLQP